MKFKIGTNVICNKSNVYENVKVGDIFTVVGYLPIADLFSVNRGNNGSILVSDRYFDAHAQLVPSNWMNDPDRKGTLHSLIDFLEYASSSLEPKAQLVKLHFNEENLILLQTMGALGILRKKEAHSMFFKNGAGDQFIRDNKLFSTDWCTDSTEEVIWTGQKSEKFSELIKTFVPGAVMRVTEDKDGLYHSVFRVSDYMEGGLTLPTGAATSSNPILSVCLATVRALSALYELLELKKHPVVNRFTAEDANKELFNLLSRKSYV